MTVTTDHPVAMRATGFLGESRWRRRPVGRVRYDTCWADGRVEFDVSLADATLRGWPAGLKPVIDNARANCPEVGTGRWVNGFAAVVDGPEVENSTPPGPRSGWPGRSGVARRERSPRVRLAWRLILGVVALGGGLLLIIGPVRDSVLASIGAFCAVGGLAILAGAVPRRFRWW